MRTNMSGEEKIEKVANFVNVAEEKISEGISISFLADLLGYSVSQVSSLFEEVTGQTIGQYLKRRYFTQIYLAIGSDAYSKLKITADVKGCRRYKQRMEHIFGKEIDINKLQRPITTEQMRTHLFDVEYSPYVDKWLKTRICGRRQRVDIGNDVTKLLLLDENDRMPYDYDHCYFKHKDRFFIIESQMAVDIPENNSSWRLGLNIDICKTEQAEIKYVFQVMKKFMEAGTVKNMRGKCCGFQMQNSSYYYAHRNKSFRSVNIIDESGIDSGTLTTLMIKEKYIILESGKLFFLLDEQ